MESGLNKKSPLRFTKEELEEADRAEKKKPKQKKPEKEGGKKPGNSKEPGQAPAKPRKLRLEEKARPPSKLKHSLDQLPAAAAAGSTLMPREEQEDDNPGEESARAGEKTAEAAVRLAQGSSRSQQVRKRRSYYAAEREPRSDSRADAKAAQKQVIKKRYASGLRGAGEDYSPGTIAENIPLSFTEKLKKKLSTITDFVPRHKRGIGIVLALFMLISLLLNGLSSCSMLAQGISSAVSGSTYPSKDEDMLGAEAAYAAMEAELQSYLDNYESTHDYDEYHYELDEIGHDPYVLISILTAYHQGAWTLTEVQGTLEMLFHMQYVLEEDVETETKTRTEMRTGTRLETDPVTGESHYVSYRYQVEVEYEYRICSVSLENFDLARLPAYVLDEDRLGMYAVYTATHGNRPDLFPQSAYPNATVREDYLDYEVPPEALEDEQFAAMLEEAEKYLGYPYVWGGSSPSTSFDCSGYVCWVLNHSGWEIDRTTANGLLDFCTPVSSDNARPGDLIFFQGTYDTPGASHVGIYVGDGMMLHCGDPISYANLNSSYWQSHFYTYGRLP